ncbi:hypothetical protein [Kitasatospora cathayae]|uniref:Gram-positive cocci surface proteins LPxTG domain-containing protein n=1 Tax=Kitasatospora cathayae TaxID=3004092 RepID=A0ABY7PX33_9ACTN|nr:hypothetical protein [Kitasatospora sp. HUAS 3-15]WBP84905.1 hypothetical protein O1G21_02920 [Kitasatospora sp. HUAS 3-15]
MRTLKAVALTAAALVSVGAATTTARADSGADVPDYGAAQQVLRSGQTHDTVSRFLGAARTATAPGAGTGADGGGAGSRPNTPNAVAAPPSFQFRDPVPMYELSVDFVAGKAQPTPQNALRLSYLASRVSAADGHQATVLLAPPDKGRSWGLAGIQDGDNELKLAEGTTADARTFTEPQIHAWYRLTASGDVEPLNSEATTGLGGRHSLPLAAYQKLVTGRYADKLPGSGYDRNGLAGGFGLFDGTGTAAGAPAPTPPQVLPEARPGTQGPTSSSASADQSSATSWQLPAAGAAVLAGAAGLCLRLRRRGRGAPTN